MEFHFAGMTPTDWRHKLLVPPKTEKIRQTKKPNVMPPPNLKLLGIFITKDNTVLNYYD